MTHLPQINGTPVLFWVWGFFCVCVWFFSFLKKKKKQQKKSIGVKKKVNRGCNSIREEEATVWSACCLGGCRFLETYS